jgi:hypothetical protein
MARRVCRIAPPENLDRRPAAPAGAAIRRGQSNQPALFRLADDDFLALLLRCLHQPLSHRQRLIVTLEAHLEDAVPILQAR